MNKPSIILWFSLIALGCSASQPHLPPASGATADASSVIPLPGGGADGILMDYLLFDPRTNAVWVPAGNTGAVDVIDIVSHRVSRIDGFPTQEMERHGKKRVVGPSSATLGPTGTVYVGNRGDFSVCAVDETTLARGTCGKLDAMPDGISFVSTTNEVWVTTPRDQSIRILDAATLVQKARLAFDGEPEGFAPDATRRRFYTNLEDKDVTLAIDLESHQTVATWKSGCGEEGPHGLRLAEAEGLLIIGCSAKVETLDVASGAIKSTLDTGDGVDDVDYGSATHVVYVSAAKAARLTVASMDTQGALTLVGAVATKDGARNGVAASDGRVYLAHSKDSEIVVVPGLPH